VADALDEPVLQRGLPEVLAGERSLSRPVRWVHVTEFAEIASVIRGGELLLTTGMGLPSSAAQQREWIAGLADRGVAGLLVELGSVLRTMPGEVRQAAVERELPLVALHRPVPFVAVTEALHPRITGAEIEELRASEAIRARLTRRALGGGGAADLLADLQAELGGRAWVVRADGEVIHGAGGAGVATMQSPIRLGGDEAWATLHVAPSPTVPDVVAQAATEVAGALIALLLMRVNERHALSVSHAGAFLADLVGGRYTADELSLRERAGGFGLSLNPGSLLPVVLVAGPEGPPPGATGWVTIARRVQQKVEALGLQAVVGASLDDEALLVVCDLRVAEDRATVAAALAHAARDGSAYANGDAVRVCVGAIAPSWVDLRDTLRAAISAGPVTRLAPPQEWHDVSVPGVEDLLWLLRDEAVARMFVERRVGPVVEADQRRGSSLFRTLEVFCEHGGHKADTARALMLERQSLYKRLGRIEAILSVDIDDQRTRLELHLAVIARRFFDRADR
jgi:purine catabolism regulator